MKEYLYLEHDGKLLLVDNDGNGPEKPIMGRIHEGESGDIVEGEDEVIVQENIFTSEGINWLSFTYKCNLDISIEEITPKEDEIEEAKWFTKSDALRNAVSIFDRDAILKIKE